jgi:hypothetical protein
MTCQIDGTNVTIRNSLIISSSDTDEIQSCANATIEASALEMAVAGNTDLPAMDPTWFVDFNFGDLHLSGTQPIEISTAAVWLLGDPSTDIDGDPRPSTADTPDFAGADVP